MALDPVGAKTTPPIWSWRPILTINIVLLYFGGVRNAPKQACLLLVAAVVVMVGGRVSLQDNGGTPCHEAGHLDLTT